MRLRQLHKNAISPRAREAFEIELIRFYVIIIILIHLLWIPILKQEIVQSDEVMQRESENIPVREYKLFWSTIQNMESQYLMKMLL